MKKGTLLSLLFIICYLLFVFAACSEPSTEETGKGYFTISLSASENMRAAYPPTNTSDLSFVAKFRNTASGAEQTYTSDGSGTIQGKIDVGNYIVTMTVSLISDGSSYARGIAYDNPVTIGSGKNQVKAYAYDVRNATPPVISAKPQGATYANGATAAALTVTASVNDGGLISYQWYSNTTSSVSDATAINGATSASYTPSTATPGTVWHYVVVTNTSTGKPTTISTVPVSIAVGAKPDPGPGTGTVADPFLVNDVAGLKKVGSGTDGWSLSAHYKQTANISLSSVSEWTPIGTDETPFKGSYNGNGMIISSLKIMAPSEDVQGLFGIIDSGAVVKNIGLEYCSIIGTEGVGGVAGYNEGTIQNCYVTGNISGNDVSGNGTTVGGIAGANMGTIRNCYATASVSGNGASLATVAVGGLVGLNTGTVQDCYAAENISYNNVNTNFGSGGVLVDESNFAGGVVGVNLGTVENCYATGSVYGSSNSDHGNALGGVVGYLAAGYSTNDSSTIMVGTVQNCVAFNHDLSAANSPWIGRIVGIASSGSITPILKNNYGRGDMLTNIGSPAWKNDKNDPDGADVSVGNYSSQSWWTTASNWNSAAWDFTNVWEWGGSLPILRNMPGTATQNPVVK